MFDVPAMGAAQLESIRLWGKGQYAEALQILDEWIARAEQENQVDWVHILCGQASMIADWINDFRLVRLYNEKVLSRRGEATYDWAMAHYRLAQAMFRNGDTDPARQHAARAYALVAHPTRGEERDLLELVLKCWPEVSSWKG